MHPVTRATPRESSTSRPRRWAVALAFTAAAVAFSTASVVHAGPLRPKLIDRSAAWVTHFDVERLAQSPVREAIETGTHPALRRAARSIARMQRDLGGLDPYDLFLDVTMYGTGETGERVAAIFNTTALGDVLGELVQEKNAYGQLVVRDTELVTWRDDGRTWFAHQMTAADNARQIIVAEEPTIVLDALAVTRGERASMQEEFASRFPATPGEGSIFFLAGEKPEEFPHDESTSAIVKQADRLSCDVGEHEGALFADLTIVAKGEREANDIAGTIAGMILVTQTNAKREARHRPWLALIDRVNLRVDALHVQCSFRAGVAPVLAAMEESHRIAKAEQERRDGDSPDRPNDGSSTGGSSELINADRREGGVR